MRPCWQRPQSWSTSSSKRVGPEGDREKSIGMVDVPLLSVPTLAEELRDHRARYFDLPGLEAMSPEQRQKWCSSCRIPSPATTTPRGA